MLAIKNLHASVAGKEILKGINLEISAGEVHSIMGPNGSGKSTLAQVLAGRESYEVTQGEVLYDGVDLFELSPDERACAGVFLAFQYPVEIPGVGNSYFLKAALNAVRRSRGEEELDAVQFLALVKEKLKLLDMSQDLLKRSVNEGFSGGEKKRNEVFQMALLEPKLAILDETDSGLDIDALKAVAEGVNALSHRRAIISGGDPLSAFAQLHRARLRACALRGADRQVRRKGVGPGARRAGLRLDRARNRCRRCFVAAARKESRRTEQRNRAMLAANTDDIVERYLASFRQRQAYGRAQQEPGWLLAQRQDAIDRFAERGFPTAKDEEWRFTNLAPLTNRELSLPRVGATVSATELASLLVPGLSGCRLVFVDGHFAPDLSLLEPGSDAVTVRSLTDLLAESPAALRSWLEPGDVDQQDAFDQLSDAFFGDGAYIHIHREAVIEEPIQLVHVTTPAGALAMTHPRNVIVAEPACQACVLEQHVSLAKGAYFTNAHTAPGRRRGSVPVALSARASERTSRARINVEKLGWRGTHGSSRTSRCWEVRWSATTFTPCSTGLVLTACLNGLYLGHACRHLDNHMRVEHAQPHGSSRQYYQGVLADQSRGVFTGRIIVHPDAQKTDAKQSNRNLLLSPGAEADSKPQLEIYADDVKCTHGATIGQLSEEALFYLRARGIDEVSARAMLVRAFAAEGLERMSLEPVREFLQTALDRRLCPGHQVGGARQCR